MNISIDSKCKIKITECLEVGESETKLIFLKKNDSHWEIFEYDKDYRPTLNHDGLYECFEKNFEKELAKELLTVPLKEIEEHFKVGSVTKKFFSICNLRKCVLELEKRTLLNSINCNSKTHSEEKKLRDLLLIAIFVLENLICDEARYSEAEEILDAMWSDCGHLCSKITNNTCNCK